jgi:hypothetical protein
MKKIFAIAAIATMLVSLAPAFACTGSLCPYVAPKPIVVPTVPCLPDQVYVDIDGKANIDHTLYTVGGWFWTGSGWSLQDFQHSTASNEMHATASDGAYYVADYKPSGSEASGYAWKSVEDSMLLTDGKTDIKDVLAVTTVNLPPHGAKLTTFVYSEYTGKLGGIPDSVLLVKGTAEDALVITQYLSPYDTAQFRTTWINP